MAAEQKQVVLTEARLPTDRFILEGITPLNDKGQPLFSVSEVSKTFFGRSPHWIRWLEGEGAFMLDGEKVGDRRKPGGKKNEVGARVYNLSDIEKMAHALASKGHINGAQLANALVIIQAIARIWGFVT